MAINKADGDNVAAAEQNRVELQRALRILRPARDDTPWTPRVLTASGLSGDGLDEIWASVEEHHECLVADGLFVERRRRQQLPARIHRANNSQGQAGTLAGVYGVRQATDLLAKTVHPLHPSASGA